LAVSALANRIVGSAEVAPDQLLANPQNWRIHPKAQQQALSAVLAEVGWVQQVIVNQRSGYVVDGHLRVALAISREEPVIPVLYVDLSPEEEALVLASLDPLAGMAVTDAEMLAALTDGLEINDAALAELLGLADPAPAGDPEAVPDTPEEPVTKPGDLYVLGEHRLLCGDATSVPDTKRLMGGKKATMMFTDPPWNVAIGKDSNPRHRQREGLKNDDLSGADFQAFLEGFIAAAGPAVTGDVYCVLGASEWPRLDATLRAAGFHWSATIIWVKDQFVLGRSKYHRRYEPIWYGWANKSSFGDDRTLDDVWEVPRPKTSEDHPTMKPVELVQRAIENSSRKGDLVLDPFGGSGTTMIAAEMTGRASRLMELDPGYCDVIVQRWEEFTGQEAKLDG
jgi:DNA modification methylase